MRNDSYNSELGRGFNMAIFPKAIPVRKSWDTAILVLLFVVVVVVVVVVRGGCWLLVIGCWLLEGGCSSCGCWKVVCSSCGC